MNPFSEVRKLRDRAWRDGTKLTCLQDGKTGCERGFLYHQSTVITSTLYQHDRCQ